MPRPIALLALSFCALMISCENKVPKGIVPEEKMENILYDYHRATAMADAGGGDASQRRYVMVRKVFEKYGVSEADFDSSMIYYSGNAVMLKDMYERIESRLKRETAEVGATLHADVYANLSEYGDTARIWSRKNLWLRTEAGENIVSVSLHLDSTYLLGDTYMMRFKSKFINKERRRDAYALFTARFDNDSVVSEVTRVSGDIETTLTIPECEQTKKHHLKNLTATLYLNYEKTEQVVLWMVSSPQIIRFHHPQPMADSVATDSTLLPADSLELSPDSLSMLPDSLAFDSVPLEDDHLTTDEIREKHQGDRTIHVVKKKQVVLPPSRPVRRRTR